MTNQPMSQELMQLSASIVRVEGEVQASLYEIQAVLTSVSAGLVVTQMVLSRVRRDAMEVQGLAERLQRQTPDEPGPEV